MHSSDIEKGFDESDALQHNLDNVEASVSPSLNDSLSSKRSEATKGYISKSSFVDWTLVAIVGIAFCLIHSHQGSFWQWTGDTAADAQSLQAKVVVSLFSAIIGGCVAAISTSRVVPLEAHFNSVQTYYNPEAMVTTKVVWIERCKGEIQISKSQVLDILMLEVQKQHVPVLAHALITPVQLDRL